MLKNWKKSIGFVIVVSLLMTTVACKGKNLTNAKIEIEEPEVPYVLDIEDEVTGSITVWVNDESLITTKYAEYKKAFEADNPGVEVNFKLVKDYDTEGYEALKNGNAGDVVMIPDTMTSQEVIETFTPIGTKGRMKKNYKSQYLDKWNIEDDIYGMPEYLIPSGLVYNKKVFEYAGVDRLPETPEELLEALAKVKESGVTPFYLAENDKDSLSAWQEHVWGSVSGNKSYQYTKMLVYRNIFDEGSPNYVVHKLLYDIVDQDLYDEISYSKDVVKKKMNNGEIACMMADWETLDEFRKAGTNMDDIGYMPFPYNINGKRYATATYGACYAIPKDSENKATAYAWIRYMLNKSNYADSIGAISIKKGDGMPNQLSGFTNVKMILVEPPSEHRMKRYTKIMRSSHTKLEEVDSKLEVIRLAKKNKSAIKSDETEEESEEESKSFDDLMDEWGRHWYLARDKN